MKTTLEKMQLVRNQVLKINTGDFIDNDDRFKKYCNVIFAIREFLDTYPEESIEELMKGLK